MTAVPTLCHGLVEAIVASLRFRAERKGLKLVLVQDIDDIVVQVDRKLLSLVVIDLVGRSIEETAQGTIHISLARVTEAGRKMIEINVAKAGRRESVTNPGAGEPVLSALRASRNAAGALGGKILQVEESGNGSAYVLQFPEA